MVDYYVQLGNLLLLITSPILISYSYMILCLYRQWLNTIKFSRNMTSINSDGVFEKHEHCAGMYPRSLILNKENSVNSGADFLDLTIEIGGDSKF